MTVDSDFEYVIDDEELQALVEGEEGLAARARPEEPPVPPLEWMKKNLFSSPFNIVLSILATLFALWAIRSLLGFVFSTERRWPAVWTNMRLLLVKSYPQDDMVRVWVSLGFMMLLTGLALGLYRAGGVVAKTGLARRVRNLGLGIAILGILVPVAAESTASRTTQLVVIGIGAVLAVLGYLAVQALGDAGRTSFVRALPIVMALLGLFPLALWVIPFGNYMFVEGEFIAESGKLLPTSTKLPWTIMWVVLVVSWLVGRSLHHRGLARALRGVLPFLWLLSPLIITWLILRKPQIDWGHVASTDFPMFLGFAAVGGAILFWLTWEGIGETGRLTAIAILLLAGATWLSAFFGVGPLWPMLQKARLSILLLGLFALAAPNFAGERAKRLRFVGFWVGFMALFHFFATLMNSPSGLVINEPQFYGGLTLTVFLAVMTIMIAFPVGVILALARTSKMPIFRVLSTIYIEVIRGVPLITILFFFSIGINLFLPSNMELAIMAAMVLGYGLFSAAYLAENVRGGLQSITRGQYEAADALGLTGAQRTGFIVLPQALRVSIPPLVGQLIATFKETSLVAIVGMFDLLRIADRTISQQTQFLGAKKEPLLFICALYWVVAYSMSKYSQRLEQRLGVGSR